MGQKIQAIAVVDCGAESGRVMIARPHAIDPAEQLTLVHRFPTKHLAGKDAHGNPRCIGIGSISVSK